MKRLKTFVGKAALILTALTLFTALIGGLTKATWLPWLAVPIVVVFGLWALVYFLPKDE